MDLAEGPGWSARTRPTAAAARSRSVPTEELVAEVEQGGAPDSAPAGRDCGNARAVASGEVGDDVA